MKSNNIWPKFPDKYPCLVSYGFISEILTAFSQAACICYSVVVVVVVVTLAVGLCFCVKQVHHYPFTQTD